MIEQTAAAFQASRAPRAGFLRFIHLFVALSVALLLGCKVDLYTNLKERETNEMLAVLLQHGIEGSKVAGDKGTWKLLVDKADLAQAVSLLESLGFPREQFADIGNIFPKEGLISSPLEERVRFVYAMSQELSATISTIDGVLSARVHIVLPENNPLADEFRPSSASVFIKYRGDSDIPAKIPQVKNLVVNSIEGLTYEKVSVALFPGNPVPQMQAPGYRSLLGVRVAPASVGKFWFLTGFLILASLAGAGFSGYLYRKTKLARVAVPEEAGA